MEQSYKHTKSRGHSLSSSRVEFSTVRLLPLFSSRVTDCFLWTSRGGRLAPNLFLSRIASKRLVFRLARDEALQLNWYVRTCVMGCL